MPVYTLKRADGVTIDAEFPSMPSDEEVAQVLDAYDREEEEKRAAEWREAGAGVVKSFATHGTLFPPSEEAIRRREEEGLAAREQRALEATREAALETPGQVVTEQQLLARGQPEVVEAIEAAREREGLIPWGDVGPVAAEAAAGVAGLAGGAAIRGAEMLGDLFARSGRAPEPAAMGAVPPREVAQAPQRVVPPAMAQMVEEDLRKNVDRSWADAITDDVDGIMEAAAIAASTLSAGREGDTFGAGVGFGGMAAEAMAADTQAMLTNPVDYAQAYPLTTLAILAGPAFKGIGYARQAIKGKRIEEMLEAARRADMDMKRLEATERLRLTGPEQRLALPAPAPGPEDIPVTAATPELPVDMPAGVGPRGALPSPADFPAPEGIAVPRSPAWQEAGKPGLQVTQADVDLAKKVAGEGPEGAWRRSVRGQMESEDITRTVRDIMDKGPVSPSGDPIPLDRVPWTERQRRHSLLVNELADADPELRRLIALADEVPPEAIIEDVGKVIEAPINEAADAAEAVRVADGHTVDRLRAMADEAKAAPSEKVAALGPQTPAEKAFGVEVVESKPRPKTAAEAVEMIMDPNVQVVAKNVTGPGTPKKAAVVAGSPQSLQDTAKIVDAAEAAASPERVQAAPRGGKRAAPRPEAPTPPPPPKPTRRTKPDMADEMARSADETLKADHAAINARRDAEGLPPMPKRARNWDEAVAIAATRAANPKLVDEARGLAQSIIHSPRPLSDIESAVVVRKMATLKARARGLAAQMDELDLDVDASDFKSLVKQMDDVDKYRNLLDAAYHVSGSEKGRALAIQAMSVSASHDPHVVRGRMKKKWGRNLTSKEKLAVEKLSGKVQDRFERLEKMEAEGLKLESNMKALAAAAESPEELLKNSAFKKAGRKMEQLRKRKLKELGEANEVMKDLAKVEFEGSPLIGRDGKVLAYLNEMFELPRTIKSSWDLSAPGRQGLILSVSRPRRAVRAFRDMLKAGWDEDMYREINYGLVDGPKGKARTAAGIQFTGVNELSVKGLTQQEEVFRSRLVAEWAKSGNPVFRTLGKGIKTSERAYVTYLNSLRAGVFDAMTGLDEVGRSAMKYNEVDQRFIAEFVNKATGRGTFGPVDKVVPVSSALSKLFYAPRLKASRFQTAIHAAKIWGTGKDVSAKARIAIAKEYWLRSVAPRMAIQYAAQEMGADVGWDGTAGTKLGRITMGADNPLYAMTIDIHGGEQQVWRAITEAIQQGRYLQSGEFKDVTLGDIGNKLFRYSLHPTISTGYNVWSKENVFARKFPEDATRNRVEEILSLVVPITAGAFVNRLASGAAMNANLEGRAMGGGDFADPDVLAGAALKSAPEFFGMGSTSPHEATMGQTLGVVPLPGGVDTRLPRLRGPERLRGF